MADSELVKQDDSIFGLSDTEFMMIAVAVAMMMMMSMQLSPIVQSISRTQQLQAFVGSEDPRTLYATSNLQHIDLIHDQPYIPWISAYIINNGPSAVKIGVDQSASMFTMYPGETITINRTGADNRIGSIYYICAFGTSAVVRVTGVY